MISTEMYRMKSLFRQFIGLISLLVLVQIGFLSLSQSAFAPTAEIKILGATSSEQSELDNLVTYELPDEFNINIQAASYLVKNLGTDQVVTGQQYQNSLPVASLTKLMTVWTALQHSDLEEVVIVPPSDLISVSPSLGLVAGDKILVKDLVQASLIGSANDAADLLGKYVAEKVDLPFAELMNQEVKHLGMTESRFSNAMGFDSVVNYSSARDLALLVSKLDQQGIFSQSAEASKYTFTSQQGRVYSVQATNKLIGQYSDLRAVKTGYTNLALGSMINILERDDQRWLIIVIGSPDRESDTLKLRQEVLNR